MTEAVIQRCSYETCSENIQQIYRTTPMPKCDFNKVAKKLYWNRTSALVFSCKFAEYFQNIFLLEQLWKAACGMTTVSSKFETVELKSFYIWVVHIWVCSYIVHVFRSEMAELKYRNFLVTECSYFRNSTFFSQLCF